MEVPVSLSRFVPRHETLFLSLHQTAPETLSGSAIGWALRTLRAADDPQEALAGILAEAVRYLETLPDTSQAEWRRAMRYLLLLIRHKREPEERKALYDVVTTSVESRHREEVDTMAKTDAQILLERGEEKGRVEGHLEGRRALLRAQLEFKFGELSLKYLAAIESISEERLDAIALRILTASTIEELAL